MGWIYLLAAGLFEIGFATSLKLSQGFDKILPSAAFLAFAAASLVLLAKAMETIPLGTAYAIWTGIGALGTAAIGMLFFKDPLSFGRTFFLLVLIGSIVGLWLVSPS